MTSESAIPNETYAPFEDLMHFLKEHDVVMNMHIRALQMVEGMVDLNNAISSARETLKQDPLPRDVDNEIVFENRCKQEVASGFPHLTSHSVVLLWASLESAFDQFIANLIRDVPKLIEISGIGKIKIPTDLVVGRSADEISRSIYQEFSKSLSLSQNWGIVRYIQILDRLSIKLELSKDVLRDLKEFVATRNLIVHRRGVCDEKFISLCPWSNCKIGEVIQVSMQDYSRFRVASGRFVSSIINATTSEEYAKVLGR